jgi:flagellar basal-body rod modification protein FlgD
MPEVAAPVGEFSTRQTAQEAARSKNNADVVNKTLKAKGKNVGEAMGKDSFLKLLVTELRHQDPTQPMADKEFIAQMAQFSSLEQMQNMSTAMTSMNKKAKMSEAYDLIGKRIEAFNPQTNQKIDGVVSHIVRSGDDINLVVNGNQVSPDDVSAIYPPSKPAEEQRPRETIVRKPSPYDVSLSPNPVNNDISTKGQAVRSYGSQEVPAAKKTVDQIQ